MKSIRIAMALVMLMLFIGHAVMAHPHYKNVKRTQYNQHQRIKHGVHSGRLTHREAVALRTQHAKVKNYKQMAMADGRITPAERRLIANTQRQTNRNIYYQQHDRQRRYR